MALIDTHSIVEDLIAAGFAKSQAEALTRLKILHYEDLASKNDLENLETTIRNEINILSTSLKQTETFLKAEVADVKAEVADVKHNLERRMDKIDTNFNWMKGIGMIIIGIGIKIAFFNS